MEQTLTGGDMTLEQKLQAITEALRRLDGDNTNDLICEGCE